MASFSSHQGSVLVVGPFSLQISALVNSEFLEIHGMELGGLVIARAKHIATFGELVKKDGVEYTAAGNAPNVAKACQWGLGLPGAGAATVVGSIGQDLFGLLLKKASKAEGVNAHYYEDKNAPTGVSAACSVGAERAWLVDQSAALKYNSEHLNSPEIWALVEKAKCCYVHASFLVASPESIQLLGEHAAEHNKVFLINLAAPFICADNMDALEKALPYTSIVFANETEARAFARAKGWEWEAAAIGDIAIMISQLPVAPGAHRRLVVIREGAVPVCAARDGNLKVYNEIIFPERLLYSNAAGDAFDGGFIAKLVQGKPIAECVEAGCYAACRIICEALKHEYRCRANTIREAFMRQFQQP